MKPFEVKAHMAKFGRQPNDPEPSSGFPGDLGTYNALAEQMYKGVLRQLRFNLAPYVKRMVYGVYAPCWRLNGDTTDRTARSVVAAALGHSRLPRDGGMRFEDLPVAAQRVVTDIWRALGFPPGERPPQLDAAWAKQGDHQPRLFRCLLFLAREISDKAFLTAKELTLVPVFKRRLLHIVLDTEAVRGILCQAQAAAPLPPQQQGAPQRRRRRRAGGHPSWGSPAARDAAAATAPSSPRGRPRHRQQCGGLGARGGGWCVHMS
jgi:hypothetical protein